MSHSYKEAIETLNKLQRNGAYIEHFKILTNPKNKIQQIGKFLNRLGISLEQLDNLAIIHIAGTNGKGTTCSYCEKILGHHGYTTGFYSSPHLLEVRERIRINGVPISSEKFAEYFFKVYNQLDKQKSFYYDIPLYFGFLTILAIHIFLAEHVDVAILEVGIGGEYDCTNIVRKTVVAGITPLDIDHTASLGNTLESIAWNKAGIMKRGAEVFTAPQTEEVMKVLKERSNERHCTLNIVKDLYTGDQNSQIPQQIQKTNASLALSVSKAFMNLRPKIRNNNQSFNFELAKQLIESTRWPGRYEIIPNENSVFYVDGAHTVDSMKVCSDWFLSKCAQYGKERVLMFNLIGKRNPENLLKLLLKCHFNTAIFLPNVSDNTKTSIDQEDYIQTVNEQLERCRQIMEIWNGLTSGKTNVKLFPSFFKAKQSLESQKEVQFDVLVTGSLHLVGAVLTVLDPTLGGLLY